MTTARDHIWAQAISWLVEDGELRMRDLRIDDSEARTARRTLNAMESVGLAARDSPQGTVWYSGEMLVWLQRTTPGQRMVWDDVDEELTLVGEGNDIREDCDGCSECEDVEFVN